MFFHSTARHTLVEKPGLSAGLLEKADREPDVRYNKSMPVPRALPELALPSSLHGVPERVTCDRGGFQVGPYVRSLA